MRDARELLELQSRWQRRRRALTWAEKIRLAERVRESAGALRASVGPPTRRSTTPPREP